MQDELQAERERGVAAAKSAIEAETRQSLDRIKSEIADLTLQATEVVLRTKLDDARVQAPDRRGAVRRRLLQADERLTMADAAALPFAEALYEAALRPTVSSRQPRSRRVRGGRSTMRPTFARPRQPGLSGRREAPRARDSMTAGGDPLVAQLPERPRSRTAAWICSSTPPRRSPSATGASSASSQFP